MQFYRTTSHTRYDIKLHFVWITKYRRPILTEEVAIRVRELVREICLANEVQILKGHISRDHVHLFVSVPSRNGAPGGSHCTRYRRQACLIYFQQGNSSAAALFQFLLRSMGSHDPFYSRKI